MQNRSVSETSNIAVKTVPFDRWDGAKARRPLPSRLAAMRIRPAADTDAGNISTLIRGHSHLLTISPDGVGAEQFLATISEEAIRRYVTAGNFLYMVAEIGNELVGAVALRNQTHLYHLFVAPAFQRQGLARLLWSTVREAALAKGNAGAFTVNSSPSALPVYERFGFVQDGPRVETHGVAFIPMRLAIDIPAQSNHLALGSDEQVDQH